MTDRTTLALQTCQGLSDEELAKRGAQAFAKMIDRKRKYAVAARTMAAAVGVLQHELAQARKQLQQAQSDLAQAQAKIATLEQLDTPITDTSEAASMLAGIATQKGTK